MNWPREEKHFFVFGEGVEGSESSKVLFMSTYDMSMGHALPVRGWTPKRKSSESQTGAASTCVWVEVCRSRMQRSWSRLRDWPFRFPVPSNLQTFSETRCPVKSSAPEKRLWKGLLDGLPFVFS